MEFTGEGWGLQMKGGVCSLSNGPCCLSTTHVEPSWCCVSVLVVPTVVICQDGNPVICQDGNQAIWH